MENFNLEKHYYSVLFDRNILNYDSQKFEDFFCDIMSKIKPNFQKVKASGRIGDRKNDGFEKEKGIYYQVYAPENLKNNSKKAINKLKEDFKHLFIYWDDKYKIKKFFFVLNDKFKGISPDLESTLIDLRKSYEEIEFNFYLTNSLKEDFLNKLNIQKMGEVLCSPPIRLDFSKKPNINILISEIIEHLVNEKNERFVQEEKYNAPNFDDKLEINNFDDAIKKKLERQTYYYHLLKNYFDRNKEIEIKIKYIFKKTYNEAILKYDNENEIFFYLIKELYPSQKESKYILEELYLLISYYFSYCDIFKDPMEIKK